MTRSHSTPAGAGNLATAVDLVFSPGPGQGKFGIWLRRTPSDFSAGPDALHCLGAGAQPGRDSGIEVCSLA
jgi:hypothetical protein